LSATVLIDELRSRGIELEPAGNHIRFRGPVGALSEELRGRLSAEKNAVLDELLRTEHLVEPAEQACALLLSSPTFGHVWLVPNDRGSEELAQKLEDENQSIPIITYHEAERLRGKSPVMLRALLATKAAFPLSKVLQ
jgi:hypothetical protein